MLIGSPYRYAIVRELNGADEPPLAELAARSHADLIIVKGFTRETLPRLEVVRPSAGRDPLYKTEVEIVAIATDEPDAIETDLPILDFDDIADIGALICERVGIALKD
ncbi:Molybdopterin-guanine dinucleotide biosynthesis MobB region [Candidatus Paraburkholderia kirkii UZHbot1]|uniref:Molybdopterin-guanine dinucleotide biosynthesis MobB region n=1 Tax=Candidatus Paraburkholderia kirkii UZHbot1 TaxID=1055526 RepID=G4M5Z3_9BURK|nr:Molybdopterin-guanine dinucleotide biosynthesis MobB region [Candidatus Paraburkholderia kirkii UZHbot1]